MSDFWDLMEQEEAQNQGGGGGYIGKVEFQLGYKVFVSGVSNDESFFPYRPGDDVAKEKALESARALGKPQYSMQFKLFRDSVLNKDVSTWNGDQHQVFPTWTDDGQQAKEAAKSAGFALGTQWARLARIPSPSGYEKDGEVVWLYWPVEVYGSEAEARSAAEAQAGDDGPVEVAPWLLEYVRDARKETPEMSVVAMSADVGRDEKEIKAALKQLGLPE